MPQFESALKNPTYTSPVNALVNAGACSLKTKNTTRPSATCWTRCAMVPMSRPPMRTWRGSTSSGATMARAGFFINRLKTVSKLDACPADQLWLAIRIDRKLGDARGGEPGQPAAAPLPRFARMAAYQRGAFDE
jgi:type IV pilus assembly protein PilF